MSCGSKIKEKGAALIVVLSFLVLVSMIASTIVIISQRSSRRIKIETDRTFASYLAEGALARLQWLMIDDLQKNANRSSAARFDKSSMDLTSKYVATGKSIPIRYYDALVKVRIFDMASGLTLSGFNGLQSLYSLIQAYSMSPAIVTNLKTFMSRFSDYLNVDFEGKSPNGMNKSDYTALGLSPLPRADQLQYRDEALWIPGSGDLFIPDEFGRISEFNIIPPLGMYFPVNSINFFSADKNIIKAVCNFTENEANTIIQGRENWLKGDNTLSIYNFIDTNYMMKLTQQFSFQDSGFYTIVVTASQGEGFYEKTMIVSSRVGALSAGGIQYYEYLVY